MVRFFLWLNRISERYREDEVTVYAAQASFFIVLSAVPFIMLLLALIQMIPAVTKSDLMEFLIRVMPDMLDGLVLGVVDDLSVKSPGTLLSVTALAALWSAAKGMLGIERGLNRIYGSTDTRNFITSRIINAGYTLILMAVCIVSLVLLVLGHSIGRLALRCLPVLGHFISLILHLRSLLAAVLFFVSFVGLYTFIPQGSRTSCPQISGTPGKRIAPGKQLPGALLPPSAGWAFPMPFPFTLPISAIFPICTAV